MDTQQILISAVKASLGKAGLPDAPGDEPLVDLSQETAFGDYTSNVALRLSRQLKRSPRDIAATLLEEVRRSLTSTPLADFVADIRIEGAGFINFYLSNAYFYAQLKEIARRGRDALRMDVGKERQVLLEFVSANPTGSLSVAHARQAAVGDILAEILSFMGFAVKREYYLNDEGNQIHILGKSVALRMRELAGEQVEFPEDHYQGDYIYDIAREAGKREAHIADLGEYAADYILGIIRKELDDFGVRFDTWYSQKSLRVSGKIQEAFGTLRKSGFLYEQDGALWFKSTEFGDDKDRVVVKSDGSYTYLAPDIAYHEDKYRRGFSWLINLWGPDHHGYIGRLKAAVQALGRPADSLSVIIVQLATIFRDGKPVQMSTRKGQYITLREVLDEVGRDASRFFFIMRRTSSHLDFDLDIAKKQTAENPVYYVQYAHARISSILRSAPGDPAQEIDLSVLREQEELELIKRLLRFRDTLQACLATADPYMLTVYVQELACVFHKFYDRHRVLGQADSLTKARLVLVRATQTVIATALELMGVSRPENM